MADTNDFLELVKEALPGLITIEAIAYRLEISVDYAKQLRDGKHKISAPIRAKLAALIAAKGDGSEPVEQFEVDLQAESLLDQLVRKSTDLEAKLANQVDPRTYKVFTDPDGRAVVTKVIARFTSIRDADEYVLFLNEQIRRGKESD